MLKLIEETPLNEDGMAVLDTAALDVAKFDTFINPKVLKEITENVYDWEFCTSFPNIRCMVKRPTGILVSYINEDGDEVEKDFRDF